MSGALVVFSGGQDSTTCLFWAKEHFENVRAVSFFYGQRHRLELDMARAIAEEAKVPLDVEDMSFISRVGKSALTDEGIVMDRNIPQGGFPNTFVPGRNLFFLSVAAVCAREHGMRDIVTGVSQTDFSGYPDCRDTFIRSLNVTLNLAMDEQFVLHTPLMWLDKSQTWELADRLGIFDLVRYRTLTCYNGVPGDGCGECPACILRRRGLEQYLERKKRSVEERNPSSGGGKTHA
ncbi:7-cyano-7-deazaguanine synthase QueC [Mailhella massiliensis]|uniref:7-cyano-7-deazaguanine synthase n=1 Tax=Mailhella massiliensis TaxID=1903261 RepID=A0A921DS34_9BACT|nr:7-cyano-7-deazaguanine synthase QueC [Mailhella massiliensis]HJD96542.1 7-cyano-7-deazaguanine synthase QueC [Mailhella massiliensis]